MWDLNFYKGIVADLLWVEQSPTDNYSFEIIKNVYFNHFSSYKITEWLQTSLLMSFF